MNTIGVLITARLGSSRLKRKHLLPIDNKPILEFLIERIKNEFKKEICIGNVKIVIATSDEPENREFEAIFSNSCDVFYGRKDNIPYRHLEVAEKYGMSAVISIDGDDILCSPEAMRSVYEVLQQGKPLVKTQDLPLGMNVMGYSVEFLKNSLNNREHEVLETGWGRIFNQDNLAVITTHLVQENKRLRFTLDYQVDYEFFKRILVGLSDTIACCTTKEIVDYVLEQQLYIIVDSVNEEYWTNFNTQVGEETKKEETR